jgi:hypothetical protein
VAILEHQGGKKNRELHVLWNTGFSEWADEEVVLEDNKAFLHANMVDAYWKDKPAGAERQKVVVEKTATTKKTKASTKRARR